MSYPEPRFLGGTGEISATARPAVAAPERIPADHERALPGDGRDHRRRLRALPLGDGRSAERPRAAVPPLDHRIVLRAVRHGWLYDGSDWTDAGPGDCFFVPPGGIHALRNEPGKPASMLILFTPGARREAFFVELAEIAASGREPSEEE